MSAQFARLDIPGHRGEPVPNEFIRQDAETHHLAVFFPGFGYTCDMPLFYYAESLLLNAGADILRVEYAYNRRSGFLDLPEDERRTFLFADASAAFHAALSQRSYSEVTVIGKSLGTLAMGHILTNLSHPIRIHAVWLTPTLQVETLRTQMTGFGGHSLLAIGTADPHHDPTSLAELQAAGCEIVVVEGADHSLDIPGDVPASVRVVERVVTAMGAFLAR